MGDEPWHDFEALTICKYKHGIHSKSLIILQENINVINT